MDAFKPKLGKHDWDGTLATPQYQLSYGRREKPADTLDRSRGLRQKLLGDAWVVVEFDSTLLALPDNEREACALAFRAGLQSLNIDFRHRSIPQTGRSSFVSRLLKSNQEAHQILALIEPAVWQAEAFQALVPAQGIRFYQLPLGDNGGALLDEIFQGKLIRQELLQRFELIVYDVASFGQMGIISTRKSFEEIQALID